MPSQDTGGLGLLQLLMQSGIPPQVLLQMLMPQSVPQTAEPRESQRVPEGNANEGIGMPNADGTPGSFGFGGQTGGQIASGFAQGAKSGLTGQAAQAAFGDSTAGKVTGKAASTVAGMGANALGAPTGLVSFLNALLGGATKVADNSLKMQGLQVAPIKFGGPQVVPIPATRGFFDDTAPPGGTAPTGIPGDPSFSGQLSLSGYATPDTGPIGGLGPPGPAPQGIDPNANYNDAVPSFDAVFGDVPNSLDAVAAAISAAVAAAGGDNGPPDGGGGPAGGGSGAGGGTAAGNSGDASDAE